MRHLVSNQRGFGLIIEIVLVAVVLAIIVFAFVGREVKLANPIAPASSPPAFKTYTSEYEGASIQYPSTWKADVQDEAQDGPGAATLTLTSPLGIMIYFQTPRPEGGGGCTEDCRYTAQKVESMPTLALDMVLESETIGGETAQVLGAMDTTDAGQLQIGTAVPYADLNTFAYPSRKHTGMYNVLMTSRISPALADSEDLTDAKNIILSLHYH